MECTNYTIPPVNRPWYYRKGCKILYIQTIRMGMFLAGIFYIK